MRTSHYILRQSTPDNAFASNRWDGRERLPLRVCSMIDLRLATVPRHKIMYWALQDRYEYLQLHRLLTLRCSSKCVFPPYREEWQTIEVPLRIASSKSPGMASVLVLPEEIGQLTIFGTSYDNSERKH